MLFSKSSRCECSFLRFHLISYADPFFVAAVVNVFTVFVSYTSLIVFSLFASSASIFMDESDNDCDYFAVI